MDCKKVIKKLSGWKIYARSLLITFIIVVTAHIMSIHNFHTANFLPNLNFLILFIVIIVAELASHKIIGE